MPLILLDRTGNATVPPGYRLIASETGFLEYATSGIPLIIRGSRLCDWADAYYRGRDVQVEEVQDSRLELIDLAPGLTLEQANTVLDALGDKFNSITRPLTYKVILEILYPTTIWTDKPSREHAARWLLWLCEAKPGDHIIPFLKIGVSQWLRELDDDAVAELYNVLDVDRAKDLLNAWIGLDDSLAEHTRGEFPIQPPTWWEEQARTYWRRSLIEQGGSYFQTIHKRSEIRYEIKRMAADETRNYYESHPKELSIGDYDILSLYLPWTELDTLREKVRPDEPTNPPAEPTAIFQWFCQEYMPFRLWQNTNAPDDAQNLISDIIRDFAIWYLNIYPSALAGHPTRSYLTFIKSANLRNQNSGHVTLLVMLDGLHYADAQILFQLIRKLTNRLTFLQDDLVLSPIPTETIFAKDAIFRGVEPNLSEHAQYLGTVLPENEAPIEHLKGATPGSLFLWRLQEPDRTYHTKNNSGTLKKDVEAQIEAVAKKIHELVVKIPPEIPLQFVITTDHGRIVSTSNRTEKAPGGFEAHGRAAWGISNREYPESGYYIEGDIALLCGASYGLPNDVAIILSENSFRTNDNRSGKENFPHGGLTPEEVIVPWVVLVRDWIKPSVEFTLTGESDAGQPGIINVHALNMSDIDLIITGIRLRLSKSIENVPVNDLVVSANSPADHQVELLNWPSVLDINKAGADVLVRQPNGMEFEVEALLSLTSNELYSRDDILEGLET